MEHQNTTALVNSNLMVYFVIFIMSYEIEREMRNDVFLSCDDHDW